MTRIKTLPDDMPAKPPDIVAKLVDTFDDHIDAYKSGKYNETQLRREFLDPFFTALGWDVSNKQAHAEAYKDVIHEDAIKVGGSTKAPDYSFRIGGVRKYFLEAKKPSVNIKEDISPAFQLRRYAWSAKLPLSILSDFEEFAVYDCRIKPGKSDKASTARIEYLKYIDYLDKWDYLYSNFSKEAILKGSFDKYAQSTKGKRGTAEVDTAFLKEIEEWRESIAKNLALRNAGLDQRDLNFSVQRIIDRIIFLRICEDRGAEPPDRLRILQNGANVYERLCQHFQSADDKYNSGLFHFKTEKGRDEPPDELTLNLKLDDKALKDIFKKLYYPESPYEFSVLPADILGQVYEQFLGKVIRLIKGHRAIIEDKPEVKKAGGVYYTPTYIVDYIVKNTVGKLLEKSTPKKAEKLKILDPACGSGSFLLGAYQFVMDWHRDWYVAKGAGKHKKKIYEGKGGEWRLTTAERKRILLNNIYGVDIDQQAVETTKLSLLLKVLEGETEETITNQLRTFHERALPDLGQNIKCGNSLIGSDFYEGQQMTILDDEEKYRINVFDWETEFKDIFKDGGFSAVIGNPPYVRIQAMKEWAPLEVEFYKDEYISASKGNYDIYVVFAERGLGLLSEAGRLGFILPHKFFNAKYGEALRGLISKGKHLADVVHFGDQQVFVNATTYTCLMFLDKKGKKEVDVVKVSDLEEWKLDGKAESGKVKAVNIDSSEWNLAIGEGAKLFQKLNNMSVKLNDVSSRIFQGLITGADSIFILVKLANGKYFSEATKKEYIFEGDLLHPLCKGSVNIRRYNVNNLTKSILFPYQLIKGKAVLIEKHVFIDKYPLIWSYLSDNRKTLENREHGKWKHDKWYALGRSQNLSEMEQVKILTPCIAKSASFTVDLTHQLYFVGSGGGGGGGYGITCKESSQLSTEYLAGLLNSKLLDAVLKSHSSRFSGGYYAYNRQYIEKLPIRTIDFSNKKEKAKHDKMVALVDNMLTLNKKLVGIKNPYDKQTIERQISATDNQIDKLVYELYDLTEDEIKIVEGS